MNGKDCAVVMAAAPVENTPAQLPTGWGVALGSFPDRVAARAALDKARAQLKVLGPLGRPAIVSQQRGEVGVGGSRNAEFLLFGLNAAVGTAAEGDDLAGRMAQIGVDVAAGDPAATPYRTTVFALSHCCTSCPNKTWKGFRYR